LDPHRLVAVGGVKVVSQQLDVDTGRLEAWFIQADPDVNGARPPQLQQTIQEPVRPAAYSQEAPPQAAIRNVVKQPSLQKFHVGGDKIRLRAIVRGRLFDLDDLFIEGKADIVETRTALPNQEPIFARGDWLELRQGSIPAATIVQLKGQPAEVGGRGMSLAGRAIDLERGRNELRIDGLGEARMPVAGMAIGAGVVRGGEQESGARSQARELETADKGQRGAAEKLHIVWENGLVFDGQTVRIAGNVEMRTATQVAKAPILEVALSQRFDFQAQGVQAQPELARVFLDGATSGVHATSDGRDQFGQIVSREQLHARNLLIDQLAGTMRAEGPGWVSSVRRQGTGFGVQGVGGQESVIRGQEAVGGGQGTGKNAGLDSVHVAFEKELVGDMATRQVEFRQQVQTTYSPAKDFADVIAADLLGSLGDRMMVMTSDVLTVTELVGPAARYFELLARGNTKVHGQRIDVDAPIVGYSSDKETLKVEGDGRATAKIWIRDTMGSEPNSLQGQRFTYNLRTGELQTDVINRLHFTLPPQLKLPGTPFTGSNNGR
jgi:hypothetical protein